LKWIIIIKDIHRALWVWRLKIWELMNLHFTSSHSSFHFTVVVISANSHKMKIIVKNQNKIYCEKSDDETQLKMRISSAKTLFFSIQFHKSLDGKIIRTWQSNWQYENDSDEWKIVEKTKNTLARLNKRFRESGIDVLWTMLMMRKDIKLWKNSFNCVCTKSLLTTQFEKLTKHPVNRT
jgi:hypothetical protein